MHRFQALPPLRRFSSSAVTAPATVSDRIENAAAQLSLTKQALTRSGQLRTSDGLLAHHLVLRVLFEAGGGPLTNLLIWKKIEPSAQEWGVRSRKRCRQILLSLRRHHVLSSRPMTESERQKLMRNELGHVSKQSRFVFEVNMRNRHARRVFSILFPGKDLPPLPPTRRQHLASATSGASGRHWTEGLEVRTGTAGSLAQSGNTASLAQRIAEVRRPSPDPTTTPAKPADAVVRL